MDIAVLDFIQAHLRSPLMDALMLAATHLGDLALVWLVAGAVLAAQPRHRRYGVAVVLAVAATAALGMLVLKPLFGRVRPFEAYGFMGLLVPPPAGDSFPSNHSMVSFAAAPARVFVPGRGRRAVALKVARLLAPVPVRALPERHPRGRRGRRGRGRAVGQARAAALAREDAVLIPFGPRAATVRKANR